MPTKTLLTVEQYLALPDFEKPYLEYIHGEAIPKIMGDWRKMTLVTELMDQVATYRMRHGGRMGTEGRSEFHDGSSIHFLLPDFSFWAAGSLFRGDRALHPPTLAVEIRSPGESIISQRGKCRLMRSSGTDSAWLIDSEGRFVEIFEGVNDAVVFDGPDEITSIHIPGLSVSIESLFAALDEPD